MHSNALLWCLQAFADWFIAEELIKNAKHSYHSAAFMYKVSWSVGSQLATRTSTMKCKRFSGPNNSCADAVICFKMHDNVQLCNPAAAGIRVFKI